ncbi:hypothetical protein F4677DRAFT_460833 [Hypoxylon crocopeplum]|nr:hypothetical protein F4677DRAFT_460833 [Hypoxylon crocopeplum]
MSGPPGYYFPMMPAFPQAQMLQQQLPQQQIPQQMPHQMPLSQPPPPGAVFMWGPTPQQYNPYISGPAPAPAPTPAPAPIPAPQPKSKDTDLVATAALKDLHERNPGLHRKIWKRLRALAATDGAIPVGISKYGIEVPRFYSNTYELAQEVVEEELEPYIKKTVVHKIGNSEYQQHRPAILDMACVAYRQVGVEDATREHQEAQVQQGHASESKGSRRVHWENGQHDSAPSVTQSRRPSNSGFVPAPPQQPLYNQDTWMVEILDKVRNRAQYEVLGDRYAYMNGRYSLDAMWKRIQRESRVMDIMLARDIAKDTLDRLGRTMSELPHEQGCYLGHLLCAMDEKRSKRYVGQATRTTIRWCAATHGIGMRNGKNGQFYELWRGQGCYVKWIPLSCQEEVDKDPEEAQLWENISQMFYCIVFQGAPETILRKYLDPAAIINPAVGLNCENPLDQI